MAHSRAHSCRGLCIAAFTISLLSGGAVSAQDLRCKSNPSLSGACVQVRGVVSTTSTAGILLTPADGRAPVALAAVPRNVTQLLRGNSHLRIIGNYEICPLPVRPETNRVGTPLAACVESARNLVAVGDRTQFCARNRNSDTAGLCD